MSKKSWSDLEEHLQFFEVTGEKAVIKALRECRDADHVPLYLPHMAQVALNTKNDELRSKLLNSGSGTLMVYDKDRVIFAHTTHPFTDPDKIYAAFEDRSVAYGWPMLSNDEIEELAVLDGDPDGFGVDRVRVVPLEQFREFFEPLGHHNELEGYYEYPSTFGRINATNHPTMGGCFGEDAEKVTDLILEQGTGSGAVRIYGMHPGNRGWGGRFVNFLELSSPGVFNESGQIGDTRDMNTNGKYTYSLPGIPADLGYD